MFALYENIIHLNINSINLLNGLFEEQWNLMILWANQIIIDTFHVL